MTKKEQDMYAVLELVLEMYERGINFLPIDLYKSHWKNFLVEDDGIRPPFGAISGLGPIAAESIYNAAKQEEFMSIDEIRIRAKIGDSTIDQLREFGILDGNARKQPDKFIWMKNEKTLSIIFENVLKNFIY